MLAERLLDAARAGELVRVRYFGGSLPGAERQLRPINIADGKVLALCMQSGETKSFVIEKMEEVLDGVQSAFSLSSATTPTTFESIGEFVDHHRATFEAQGWVVQHQGQAVSLHRTFKNGKLIQTPDVALLFKAETYDLMFDGEKCIEANRRERSRPWIVRGKNKTTRTFVKVGGAELSFLEWAALLAPGSAR